MEVPIPNFYFMGVQFVHLLALSLWVGGLVVTATITAPVLFSVLPSRALAGQVFSEIHKKLERVLLASSAALVMTGVIKYRTWENLTPWNLGRYIAIGIMSVSILYSFTGLSPRLRALQVQEAGAAFSSEREAEFKRLHRLSYRCMWVNLIGGLVVLLLA